MAERDPSRGVMEAPTASVVGGRLGAPAEPERDAEAEGKFPGAATTGRLSESPGRGVREGAAGEDHRRSARVANGRPSVAEGTPSVTATYTARPNDNVDSEQEVAATVRSLVHASVAGGAVGAGRGGDGERATAPGAGGGVGQGSVARPMGRGDGDVFDLYTSDPMLVPYFRKLKAKIDPLWADAFPKSALAELKQGTVILEFTIGADGSAKVAWPPRRPSGVDAFDRNCADAIRRAAPFDPIPATLRERGYTRLRILAPFEAKNPIVK